MIGSIIWLVVVVVLAVIAFGTVAAAMSRYKRCPSDKILVIYGKTGKKDGKDSSARCVHGGAAFVWPLIQAFQFMDLTPITIDIPLRKALSRQNIRIDVPSVFTVGISTDPSVMTNAAERLLGLSHQLISDLAKDIILGQLRVTIAMMDIEDINADRDKFLENVVKNVEAELQKIGLKLINVNVTDISDESGYIEALGKKAAAEAVNQAKVDVSEKDRDGETGKANAEREQRVNVASANAEAVKGENQAKVDIANSDAERDVKTAEAKKLSTAAEMVQLAKAKEEGYVAEQAAELKRADKESASKKADIIVPAEIAKQKMEIDADAVKEKQIREATGKGEATFKEMEGEARGILEILTKRADGFKKIVEAAGGNAKDAAMLMIVDKLEQIAGLQAEAIKNIKFDKIVVMDGGGNGAEGNTTAHWLSGITKALPGLHEFATMAGVTLPEVLGKSLTNGATPISGQEIVKTGAEEKTDIGSEDETTG